jgi:hypothetical protein
MHVMQREMLHCTWWSVERRQSRGEKKHKLAVQNNNSTSNYLGKKNIGEMEKQLSLGAEEATFAYHTAVSRFLNKCPDS